MKKVDPSRIQLEAPDAKGHKDMVYSREKVKDQGGGRGSRVKRHAGGGRVVQAAESQGSRLRSWTASSILFLLSMAGCAGGSRGGGPDASSLTILTYNVLGSKVLPTDEAHERRVRTVLKIIEECRADIVCLQEVRAEFLERLKSQPWFGERYRAPKHRGEDALANGNYVCAKFEVTGVDVVEHRSLQGRASLVVHVLVGGEAMAISTCHLESPLPAGGLRARQLDDVFMRLKATGDAIFAGDFNFGDEEQPDTAHLDPDFTDLWRELHPGDPGLTWDIVGNPLAEAGSFVGEPSRRIDRILVRSRRWGPVAVELIGTRAFDGKERWFPSDHYGLLGTLRRVR